MSGGSGEPLLAGAEPRGRWLIHTEGFLGGWRFAVFALAVLGGWTFLLSALLLLPMPQGALSSFAEQFRVWCLGYDAATGEYEPIWTVMLYLDPLLLASLILGVWWKPLRAEWREHGLRGIARWIGAGFGTVLAASALLGVVALDGGAGADADAPLPFPARELRTELPAPPLDGLVAHGGAPFDPARLEGKVVLITAIYGCCTQTCPILVSTAQSAIAALPPELGADLAVLGVTMDPEHDTPASLADLARGYGLDERWSLLGGEPERVHSLLDRMSVARERDEATGVIDHANLYLLLDRSGRLAYRLTLPGPAQAGWLRDALETLLREDPDDVPGAGD